MNAVNFAGTTRPTSLFRFPVACTISLFSSLAWRKFFLDGSNDDAIHCFKEGQPCSSGKAILHAQLAILKEPDVNPFEATDSDVEEAYPPSLELRDSDQDGDSDIEID